MKIEKLLLCGFQCFCASQQEDISLDPSITALIGNNGSGKTALLTALQRLFGETRGERTIKPEDFHLAPGETIDFVQERRLYIEAWLSLPELEAEEGEASETVPHVFNEMHVAGLGESPTVRIRLEATWAADATLEGNIDETIYYILSPDDVVFGDVDDQTKVKMSPSQRSTIVVRYIPASRDVAALSQFSLRQLGRDLGSAVEWADKKGIEDALETIAKSFGKEPAIRRVNEVLDDAWQRLNAADTETNAVIGILPPEFQQVIRGASVSFTPSVIGRSIDIGTLSDGQRSLFYFALVKAILQLKLDLEATPPPAEGELPLPFAPSYMRAPALTIFAFEEPENHLAPYFMSRMFEELKGLTDGQRVQGVLTSHSPAIVGRIAPEAIRYLYRDFINGVSLVRAIELPEEADEARKYVREAVRAYPEIYFARFAVFCEGASEEVVLPRLGEALGIPIDRSFVAIVPIGGRHVRHFWRLAEGLGIPYATLIDFDLGRSTGDVKQLQVIARALLEFRKELDSDLEETLDDLIKLDRPDTPLNKGNRKTLLKYAKSLEELGMFFSYPLDLDFLMLKTYPDAFQTLEAGETGPQNVEDADRQDKAMKRALGSDGLGLDAYNDVSEKIRRLFPWYTYLFMSSRGKPGAHLAALSRMDQENIKENCPKVIKRLIKLVATKLRETPSCLLTD